MSQVKTYPLMSWSSFGGIDYNSLIKSFDAFITGFSSLSREATTAALYTSPVETYPNIEYRDSITYRNNFRQQDPILVGATVYYRQLPSSCTPSQKDQAFAEKCLLNYSLSQNIGKVPFSSYTKDILLRYGTVGDLVKFTDRYFSFYQYDPSLIFVSDKGLVIKNDWVDNYQALYDKTPLTYNYSRPFLLFDTRDIVEQGDRKDTITDVKLVLTLDAKRPPLNEDDVVLYVSKVQDSASTGLGSETLLDDVGFINTKDQNLLNSIEVEIPIANSAITKNGYTKLAIVSTLERLDSLPTGFNQFSFIGVSLKVTVDPSTKLRTSPVPYFTSSTQNNVTTFQWNQPIDNGGSPITAYLLKNNNTGEEYWTPATQLTYSVNNLLQNTQYTFSIQAQNNVGLSSPTFAVVSLLGTKLIPGPVSNFTLQGRDGSIVLTWSPPLDYNPLMQLPGVAVSGTFVSLDGYTVTNITTGESVTTLGTVQTVTFSNLDNSTDYTFKIQPFNTSGYGPESFVIGRPVPADENPPEIPEIVSLRVKVEAAALTWKIPKSIFIRVPYTYEYFIKITNLDLAGDDPTDPGVHWYKQVYETGNWGGSILIPNLVPNTRYRACVKSSNAVGESPYICTAVFTVPGSGSGGGGGGGGIDPGGKVLIPVEYNYKYFYQAPIHLDRAYDTYNSFIYPQTVTEDQSAFIQGEEVEFPIVCTSNAYKLYFNISGEDYTINLTPGVTLSYSTLAEILNSHGLPVTFSLVGKKLIVETVEKGDSVYINFDVNFEKTFDATELFFGTAPSFIDGSTITLVENYVPTTEYDRSHSKALVESKVSVNIYNKNVSQPSLWTKNSNKFSLSLVNTSIQPNSVVIQYVDDTGNRVFLRDYIGDGYLYSRKKTFDAVGDPITWSYSKDDSLDSILLGKIDYITGAISDLVFYTENGVNSFRKAVIKSNAVWPIKIVTDSTLYLLVGGTRILIPVVKNTTTGYYPSSFKDLLNSSSTFSSAGLIASVVNSQLVITNTKVGPTETLELDNIQVANNCNRLVFGFKPTIITPSQVFVSYSYTVQDSDKFHYIWYQTPHFLIKAKGTTGTFLTKAHLDYIVNKVLLIKPTTTVLDKVQFNLTTTDNVVCSESLNIYVQTPPPDPNDCTYTLSSLSLAVDPDGDTGLRFDVTASSTNCEWTVTSNDNWITITSLGSMTGSGTVFFDVDANAGADRQGTISVAGQTFTITQAAVGGCSITVSPNNIYIINGGVDSKIEITVTTGTGCSWSASSPDSWIRVPVTASGTGSGTFSIGVLANRGATRTGTLLVGDQIVQVTQEGSIQLITPPYLRIGSMISEPSGIVIPPIRTVLPGGGIIIEPPPTQNHTYDIRVTNPDDQFDLKEKYYTYQ